MFYSSWSVALICQHKPAHSRHADKSILNGERANITAKIIKLVTCVASLFRWLLKLNLVGFISTNLLNICVESAALLHSQQSKMAAPTKQ